MGAHSLKAVQKIPVTLKEAWDFFSNPANLPQITPGEMSFRIISQHHGERMYPGQIIEYTVAPLWGIRMYWMTEITHVEDQRFFIDEQRYGPYSMWHHQHHFQAIDGGVEMTDIVHYKNPFGVFGSMVNASLVRPRLRKIFQYRFEKVEQLFGAWPGGQEKTLVMY